MFHFPRHCVLFSDPHARAIRDPEASLIPYVAGSSIIPIPIYV